MVVAPHRFFRHSAAALLVALAACGGGGDDQPGPPASLDIVAGGGQQAVVANLLPIAPSVRVRDANGTALSGIVVRYSVQTGGGTIGGDSVRTDANGVAPLSSWRLGPTPGQQTLRAIAQGTTVGVTIAATATAGAPAVLAAITPQSNAALVASTVTPLPTVEVRDGFGNILPGVPVTFTVTLGGGSATGTEVTSDANGRATVGSWTLGQTAGLNRLTARAGLNASFVFEAQGLGAAPASVAAISPTSQSGFLRFMVPQLPRVVVRDEFGNPSAGIPVTFAMVGGGDASLTGVETITGFDGVATPTDWRLGLSPTSAVEATVSGFALPKVTFQASGTAAPFLVDVRFIAPPTANDRDAFAAAALRWMSIITGDLPDLNVNRLPGGVCSWLSATPALNEAVDDVIIFAQLTTIDGPGGILGQAGPCIERSITNIPAAGGMQFDVADLTTLQVSNRLLPVIMHEMGHVLGIGTVWVDKGLLVDAGSLDPIFTGAAAGAAWPNFALGYAGRPVPVANVGPLGSRDSHWRESVLTIELMTPTVEASGVFMPLSRLSIASLGDLGYDVDMSKADSYAGNLLAPSVFGTQYPAFTLNEILHRATLRAHPDGKITPID